MVKLRKSSESKTEGQSVSSEAPQQADVVEQTPESTQAANASQPAATVPFVASDPATSTPKQAGQPNIIQARKDRIAAAVAAGKPFTYDAEATAARKPGPFTCICGSQGKNPHVLKDKNGDKVMVGGKCLEYCEVEQPKREKKERTAPGVDRKQKMAAELNRFQPPFTYVGKREGSFICICGGKGKNQIVIKDSNGAELAVGQTCAAQIPGVELPKPQRKQEVTKVAGLKGSTTESAPDFSSVG